MTLMKSNKAGNIGYTTATYRNTEIVVQTCFSTQSFYWKSLNFQRIGMESGENPNQQINPEIKIRLLYCDSASQYPSGFWHRSGIYSFFKKNKTLTSQRL